MDEGPAVRLKGILLQSMTRSSDYEETDTEFDHIVGYWEDLDWTPDKGDRFVLWEFAKYPEATGIRKTVLGLCISRTDPAIGVPDVPMSTDPAVVFAEIAKFAFMFSLVAGYRMAHAGLPEPLTPEKQKQIATLELESDPEAVAAMAERYRAGLEQEQRVGGFTALELLESEFERDPRSEIYLAAWANRAEQLTRYVEAKSASEVEQAGLDLNELWFEICSVGMFAGMELYEERN